MANRKLQQEIDKTIKKIDEGIDLFDETWEKVYDAETSTLRDKFEGELKKEIKKLQRLRDKIKAWLASNEVKDKKQLLEYRKTIENRMEKFKQCERESKMKAYSKEALAKNTQEAKRKKKKGVEDSGKKDTKDWIERCIDSLEEQVSEVEEELQSMQNQRKPDLSSIESMEERIERHKKYLKVLRDLSDLLDHDHMTVKEVNDFKESIDYYISDNQQPDLVEDESLFEVVEEKKAAGEEKDGEENGEDEDDEDQDDDDDEDDEDEDDVDDNSSTEKSDVVSKKDAAKVDTAKSTKDDKKATSGAAAAAASITPSTINISKEQQSQGKKKGGNQKKLTVDVSNKSASPSSTTTPTSTTSSTIQASSTKGKSNVTSRVQGPTVKHVTPVVVHKNQQVYPSASQGTSQQSKPLSYIDAIAKNTAPKHQDYEAVGRQVSVSPMMQQATSQQQHHQIAAGMQPSEYLEESDRSNEETFGSQMLSNMGSLEDLSNQTQTIHQDFLGVHPAVGNVNSNTGIPSASLPPMQVKMLEQSVKSLPHAGDTDKPRQYVPQNLYKTPDSFPTEPSPIFSDPNIIGKMDLDCLFFIFYFQQGTYQQYLAAKELKKQAWRFHKKYLTWFQRHDLPKQTTSEYELGTYVYFDYETAWCQRIKTGFRFEYEYLEDDIF